MRKLDITNDIFFCFYTCTPHFKIPGVCVPSGNVAVRIPPFGKLKYFIWSKVDGIHFFFFFMTAFFCMNFFLFLVFFGAVLHQTQNTHIHHGASKLAILPQIIDSWQALQHFFFDMIQHQDNRSCFSNLAYFFVLILFSTKERH